MNALVLGGGGVVGLQWELGVLTALQDAGVALEPDVIVGTSAGSVIGALLRMGVAFEEMRNVLEAPPMRPDFEAMMEIFKLWLAGPITTERAREVGRLAGAASAVPEAEWVGSISRIVGADWPDGELRVTAVGCDSGERVVWTGASGVPLDRAVAASCAVPGLLPPVTVDGRQYVDGGVVSSNAVDVASGAESVVFVAPIMGYSQLGKICEAILPTELERLGRARFCMVSPGPDFEPLALNLMDPTGIEPAFEIGVQDGRNAAAGVAETIG